MASVLCDHKRKERYMASELFDAAHWGQNLTEVTFEFLTVSSLSGSKVSYCHEAKSKQLFSNSQQQKWIKVFFSLDPQRIWINVILHLKSLQIAIIMELQITNYWEYESLL